MSIKDIESGTRIVVVDGEPVEFKVRNLGTADRDEMIKSMGSGVIPGDPTSSRRVLSRGRQSEKGGVQIASPVNRFKDLKL